MMRYRSQRQADGTYTIQESRHGLNWEIHTTGVRGCNVDRIINRLRMKDLFPTPDTRTAQQVIDDMFPPPE